MPAKMLFTLGVGHVRRRGLPPGARADEPGRPLDTAIVELSELQWRVLVALKREFAPAEIVRDLWAARAVEAGVDYATFVDVARSLEERRVIGRFSTFLEHVKPTAGNERVTRYNALFHWAVAPGREIEAGSEVARHFVITHAYWREGGPEFHNVNVMAVAHGMEKAAVLEHKAAIDEHLREAGLDFTLQQKAFAELASGSSFYDIMIIDTPWMPALTNKIEPITEHGAGQRAFRGTSTSRTSSPKVFFDTAVYKRDASNLHFDKSDIVDPAAIKAGGFDIFGLPMQANVLTLAYRTDFSKIRESESLQGKDREGLLAAQGIRDEFAAVAKFFTNLGQRRWGTTLMAGRGRLGDGQSEDVAGWLWRRRPSRQRQIRTRL